MLFLVSIILFFVRKPLLLNKIGYLLMNKNCILT
ncbi:hypothetical protein Phi12:1_gp27 [Cellulophaga phage phi12:1]|uniref:Uncharacterized protein n=2 Tax=Cellulophaga phage phi12:1 TaxID=1327976 RepID=S0A1A1_9CAUD|nr:hypothetical protein Phi12:1_gp27 [Cellulophaga phage phi12:1]AGO47993.1 hypothetical protein Phi12:1_gp27 [Cellulophaga phage phi12:1]AGO48158.1 hypothetical protein Phi12:3_gp27 [Cellulophaga phage phi12:3]